MEIVEEIDADDESDLEFDDDEDVPHGLVDSESDDEPVNKKRETMYESESESEDDGDLTMAGFLKSNRERIEANKHRVARHWFIECDESWKEKMKIIEPSAPCRGWKTPAGSTRT